MSHYYNNDHGPRLVFAKEGGEGLLFKTVAENVELTSQKVTPK